MRATVFLDVLSHWCMAAMPATHVLADLTPEVEIVFAPIKNGGPLGNTHDEEQWYFKRGALAYGRELRVDWCESPQTTSWFANAIALVGAKISGEALRTTHAVMSAALEQGALLGRADQCIEYMAKYLGMPAKEVAEHVNDPSIAAALDEGNRRLSELGADERPTFLLENTIGDRALLKGLWQKELLAAAGLALLQDERAYQAAGPAPF